jgi:hypothetical protein
MDFALPRLRNAPDKASEYMLHFLSAKLRAALRSSKRLLAITLFFQSHFSMTGAILRWHKRLIKPHTLLSGSQHAGRMDLIK